MTEAELYDLEQWWRDNPEASVAALVAEVRRLTAENERLQQTMAGSAADIDRWRLELERLRANLKGKEGEGSVAGKKEG